MNREQLENFIGKNQDNIIGISVEDYYYNVDCILDYNLEFDNEPIICCSETKYYGIEDLRHVEEVCFTMNDLIGMDKLEFFERKKIEV